MSGLTLRLAISPPRKNGPKRSEIRTLETLLVRSRNKTGAIHRQRQYPFPRGFFPGDAHGAGQPYKLVDEIPANEFYNLEGRQFSKSEGWTIDLRRFLQPLHADQIRYAIAANAPETSDSEFTWKDFQSRCNAELLGKYGNLANRVLVFIASIARARFPNEGIDEMIAHFRSDHRYRTDRRCL